MDSIFVVCIWLSITFAAGKAKSTANEVFAISGCNAELEWTLGKTYLDVFAFSLKVFNANGIEIAQKEDTTCKNVIDSSVYCEARNTNGEEWRFFVVLINVTQANSGKYTGQIQTGRGYEANITTDLSVIDKPRITELRKPVLYESFSVMCTTSYTSDCIIYYWKINGSDLQDSINIHATLSTLTYRNVTMMDNFSTLTCRAGIEKCSNILCNSSEDSDPYTIELYYGPLYVYLSHNESLVYLEENRTFKVKCSASCYPACIFRWESYYINVDNAELVIHNFNERLSGPYTCIAKNRETGVTANSYPLFLRHAKGDPLLVFTGCDATLQWNIGNSSYKEERIYFRITGNAGDVIATEENNQCMSQNNLSMSCVLSHKNEDWIIFLTLMNITTNHTGNYTAWLREEQSLHFVKKTTPLIVIDKPRITEIRKPVLYQSFTVKCYTSYISDCITYYWKINGSDLQDYVDLHATMSTLTYRNVTVMDNFSTLTCQARLEKCSNILCNSSEDSEPYTVEPYYGPMYVSLTLNESHIYLEENTTFKVQCSANCYPACAFRWENHYINVDNEELIINSFNERLSGAYTCTARNRETGVTAKSYPLFLHYAKVTTIHSNIYIDDTGHREVLHWIGPVFFVAAFVIFVTVWRIKASREIENRRKREARAEQADSEVSRANTLTNSRALPCPPVLEDLFRRTNRLDYPKLQRHFRSLEKLSDQDKDVCNQKRENMCLQTLSHSSNVLNRHIRDGFTKIKSTSEKDNLPYSIEGSPKGSRLLKRFARTKTSGMINKDYHETGTNSQPLISLQRSHDGSKLQEDPYNTIDENVLTVYDYSTYNAIDETSQETERRPEHRMYYYASSSDVYHVETADVHATDESYLNPISDLAHPSETCQLDERDMNGTDTKYITIIDDFSYPVEETNVTEADPTYITPIMGSQ